MYDNKTIIAVIPARGGSKGLVRKNIRPLLGKPLIAWTIEQALASKYTDRVIVTTDDNEIAEISRRYGAQVPFMRPEELSKDGSPTIEVLLHALSWLEEKSQVFDYLMLLEPTSPLREKSDIDETIRLLISNKAAKAIVSVARLESAHPEFNVVIDKKTCFIRKLDGSANFNVLRRQDLRDVYFFDGTIYISEIKSLVAKKTFYHDLTLAYIVPRWKSLEIDELQDFICAEALLKSRLNGLF